MLPPSVPCCLICHMLPDVSHVAWCVTCCLMCHMLPEVSHVAWGVPCCLMCPMLPDVSHVAWGVPCCLMCPMLPDVSHVAWGVPCCLMCPMLPDVSHVAWRVPCCVLQGTTVGPAASEGAPRGQDHGLLQGTRETEEEQEPRSQAPPEDEGTQGWHASLWANTNARPGAMQDPSTNFSLNMEYIFSFWRRKS